MCIVTGRAVTFFKEGVYVSLPKGFHEILMTIPTELIRRLYQEMFQFTAVGIMAVCTQSLLYSAVGIGFFKKLPEVIMTVQTEGIYVIDHKVLMATDMGSMARAAFSLSEEKMSELLQEFFPELFMALVAELWLL
jgi:hypothetical protein